MTMYEILENNQTNKLFEDCVNKSFFKYKLFRYMDKEEFYQECCIYTMERIHKYNSNGCSLSSYLYKIMTWCAMQQYNKAHGHSDDFSKHEEQKKYLRLDEVISDEVGADTVGSYIKDDSVNVEETIINRITLTELPHIETLTEKQKIVVECILEGKPNFQIAQLLNCSESYVRNLIVRIRKKLLQEYTLI